MQSLYRKPSLLLPSKRCRSWWFLSFPSLLSSMVCENGRIDSLFSSINQSINQSKINHNTTNLHMRTYSLLFSFFFLLFLYFLSFSWPPNPYKSYVGMVSTRSWLSMYTKEFKKSLKPLIHAWAYPTKSRQVGSYKVSHSQ
jgi:hypothetical protein